MAGRLSWLNGSKVGTGQDIVFDVLDADGTQLFAAGGFDTVAVYRHHAPRKSRGCRRPGPGAGCLRWTMPARRAAATFTSRPGCSTRRATRSPLRSRSSPMSAPVTLRARARRRVHRRRPLCDRLRPGYHKHLRAHLQSCHRCDQPGNRHQHQHGTYDCSFRRWPRPPMGDLSPLGATFELDRLPIPRALLHSRSAGSILTALRSAMSSSSTR